MKNTIRAYLPVGGAWARGVAWRLFCCYGIRPRLISRSVSVMDRLFPLWRVEALPPQLPDDLFARALCEAAAADRDDRLAVLYWNDATLPEPLRADLEECFVLRYADGSAYPDAKEASPL